MLSKIRTFLAENVSLSEKNWHTLFVTIFQVSADEGMGKLVAQKGHTCKLKMLLPTKNFTCKLKMLLQTKNRTCELKMYMQTKNITNMEDEWTNGCKARSHGSDQVLITRTARAGLFIFNLHRNVLSVQFAAQFLVCMYYI